MKAIPDPIYVQEFLFKESNTTQICDGLSQIPNACNLLVADKKRGLLYIGHNDKITVLKPAEENSAEWKIELQLPGTISKIAINCDYRYVAVTIAQKPSILIYAAYSLARNSPCLLFEIGSSKDNNYITDIRWNPTFPMMLCTVISDYTFGNFLLKEETRDKHGPKLSFDKSKMSNEVQVLCAAWSPKGKQLAVGCKNGDIVQLKPDLKIARTIAGPSPSIGEVISILWISNYQFCAAYLSNERHINVLIVDAPKGEANAAFTCYEDITYGFSDADGEESVYRYYFEYVPEWGLIIAGSSNSSEIAVLGTTDGGANWNLWQLVDNGRAQLPLMRTTEIFPIGLAVDRSPTNRLPWGTDAILQNPVPILHILGTSGKLCSFHMVNLVPNCPAINSPPTEIVTAPPQPPVVSLTEMSFNMNTVVTSTPRPKQPELVPERAKAAPITNIFGDSLKAAGFFQQPSEQPMEQSRPSEGKAIAPVVAINKPLAAKETPAPESAKIETKPAARDNEVSSPQVAEQKSSIDDSVRMRAYLQEVALFEKEWRGKLEPQVWECGTDKEKKRLGETSAIVEQFLKELKETTGSLASDIAYLKTLLLQSFAWIEETKSKNASSTDMNNRNCGENSKIADLQRTFYYAQTQLNQVSKILDLEWSEHKAQEMTKMKIPSLEFVYQNLLLHSKIIAKEKEKLEQISRRWKFLSHSPAGTVKDISNLNRSMSSLHISLPRTSVSTIQGRTDAIDAHCRSIASKTLSFTHEKQAKLKALLVNSSPKIIKPVNPSPVQDRLKATLSSLASVNSTTPPETKSKVEPLIMSKPSIVNKQIVEKAKSQSNPLASLNSIVARIGTSDTNGIVMQNKTQQKPASTTTSFPAAISVKQTEKKLIIPTIPTIAQVRPKQDLNINFPSITFSTPAPKSQDIFFPKPPAMDTTAKNNKESVVSSSNDIIVPKASESALFSTSLLKDVLSTEYSLTKTEGIARSLPSLPVASAVKTDAAATFSFATPSVVPSVAKSSSATPLDAMMSFTYSKPSHTPAVESSVTVAQSLMQPTMQSAIQPTMQSAIQPVMQSAMQPTMQATPIELAALSLGSSSPLNLQQTSLPSVGTNGKVNTIATISFATSIAATTQPFVTTTVTPSDVTIGGLTISLANTNATSKLMETPVSDSVTIQAVATPEVKSPTFGAAAAQVSTSLPTASIFGSQIMVKSMATLIEPSTTPPATTIFGAAAFPSIAPTFDTSTSASTASVFSGFSNISTTGATTYSSATTVTSNVSPFQSSLGKPVFGESATSMPATSFGITTNNTSAAKSPISFGIPTTTVATTATVASITPAFGKSPIASPTSNAQFGTPNVQTPPVSTANVFGKNIISPASTPFSNTSGSVFNMPATSSNTPIFGGGGSGMNSIFGSTPLTPTSGNMFGGNSTVFGATPSVPLFDSNAPKSGGGMFGGATNAAPASPFGSATSNASPTGAGASPAGANVFKSPVTNTSPMGVGAQQPVLGSQPVFGQTPAFGAKPMFGSPPSMFGASKPVFGSGFGSPPTFETPGMGFGAASPMQGGSTMENVMPKVFGDVAGSSTFESLANQSGGLSFGSLAQKSPEAEKPAFTASSFSSWR
ncbi:nuclear pore complex protein Nup214-like isoform X2 [Odontomachus brunneus]|uniref:nuclear pore complex protein Nup214-like isoform X2 n=1 Tax=Odontomachus brunneus TaxID=486640 RepID=UPI0013F22826|nr:nuclear pore complex protein Nup214-like isoform X2 [Odontomachus brunneus]